VKENQRKNKITLIVYIWYLNLFIFEVKNRVVFD
jgi:hypothetical protein